MQVSITVKCRQDYNTVFNGLVGDSKNYMTADPYLWTFNGTMTSSDYDDLVKAVTSTMPGYPITIVADGVETIVSYDYDDDEDWITVNGKRI